jgi:hypothetical protein
MTIPTKGSRQIIVDGEVYRWSIRRRPTHCQHDFGCYLNVAIENAKFTGTTLIVEIPQAHPSTIWASKEIIPVLPSDIECCIRQAIAQGWKPLQLGSSFQLCQSVFK